MKNVIAKCGAATLVAITTSTYGVLLFLFVHLALKNRWGQYFDGSDPVLGLIILGSVVATPILIIAGLSASISSLVRNEPMSILSIPVIGIDLLAIVAIVCRIGLIIDLTRLSIYLALISFMYFGFVSLTRKSLQSPPSQLQTQLIQFAEMLPTLLACMGTSLLLVAVFHIRVDRSIPYQTSVIYAAPLGGWLPELVYIGLALSFVGILGAAMVVKLDDGRTPIIATVAIIVAIANTLGTLVAHYVLWRVLI